MGKALHGCASCLSITSMILIIVSLAVPWYFLFTSFTFGDSTKSVGLMIGWRRVYCVGNDCGDDPSEDWRKQTGDSNLPHVFDATLGMMVVALLLTIVSVAISFVRCCSKHSKSMLKIIVIVTLALSLLFTAVSVIYFAVAVPKELCKGSLDDTGKDTPCSKFIGSQTDSESALGINVSATVAWGGAGWAVAIPAIFFTLLALIFSAISKDGDEYSRIGS
eukprot:TRINITY_DN2792_c0_g3_i6.p1 TRINITY_DN2792_c0_g3~~TRINITY_DN2792_c0_g3_i6.p1  ORF type:complete len:220 (+),score=45.53 TRINITY_DN2792_c0_g3_i6:900-1559(+)